MSGCSLTYRYSNRCARARVCMCKMYVRCLARAHCDDTDAMRAAHTDCTLRQVADTDSLRLLFKKKFFYRCCARCAACVRVMA
jgi:hypothetical protein